MNYLSPSALAMLEERPVEFYLRRLGPPESAPPPEPQGFPAAVGLSFDGFVKEAVAKECALPRGSSVEYVHREVREQRDRALAMGAELLYGYRKCGAFARLVEEKPQSVHLDAEDFAPGTTVPVRAKLDATTLYMDRPTPHDWKVAGANRPGQVSPTQGYARLWDTDTPGIPNGPHKRYGEYLECFEPDWATQLTIYGWAMGLPVTQFWGSIDQILPGVNGRVRVAQFRSPISEDFQRKVVVRLQEAWRRIIGRDVLPPEVASMDIERVRVMM